MAKLPEDAVQELEDLMKVVKECIVRTNERHPIVRTEQIILYMNDFDLLQPQLDRS